MDKNTSSKSGEQLFLPPIKKKKPYYYIVIVSAFLGALILWFYVIGYDTAIFEREIPGVSVTITGIDKLRENKQFMITEDINIEISVTIAGKRSEINNLKAEDLTAMIDVSEVDKAGYNDIDINVTAPNGIGIKAQSLISVQLYLDEFILKTVPVSVITSDYILPEGLKIGQKDVNPVVVTVEGPKSEIDKINSAYVELSLGEVTGSITAYGPMFLKYDNGEPVTNKYVKLNKEDAYVYISVEKEKTVPVKIALTGGIFTSESAVITLSQEYITISGNINLIDSISQVTINLDETAYDLRDTIKETLFLRPLLPAGVEIVSGEVQITAEIKIPDITKKKFSVSVDEINVTQIDGANIIPTSGVTVTVVGNREILSGMMKDQITASIDAAGVFFDDDGNEVAYVDFTFADEIYGVYVYGEYTVRVDSQQ
ncbi:MAG: hypothetical protein A2Y15_02760 [Clostridiales bacterium GWF2_36_10]|nr:MAG: hypothetical protein A2Y15_02760 [Clostridiales bacterium GWF2_36_10]HAN21128.1 hypothetical protein [Clostridiales bacterium]